MRIQAFRDLIIFLPICLAPRGFKPKAFAPRALRCTAGPNRRARRARRFATLYQHRRQRRHQRRLLLAGLRRHSRLERHGRRLASLPLSPAERAARREAKCFRRCFAAEIAALRERQLAIYRKQLLIGQLSVDIPDYFIF